MSSGYALHPEAFTDLDDIHSYIAKDSLDAADRVITEIFDSIRDLIPFPHQGHRRPELTLRPLRFALVREYMIACGCNARTAQSPRDGRHPQR
jgi:plasmid stabilization system protein ParE